MKSRITKLILIAGPVVAVAAPLKFSIIAVLHQL